ncbi:wax ester/triacylglycerol synthase domain-containing protein [Streptomyces ziwulingensis]|uniref:O-acyltransferase WSD1-like N-terminal domain-containing protein n=1 Tax=Streptomyces ziwulingensis TaxID=1045501 RepID=A0ABP9CNN9_9ACTN
MHVIRPIDRAFFGLPAEHAPVTGFFFDFLGPPPPFERWRERVSLRAGRLPVLARARPSPGARVWARRGTPLDIDAHVQQAELPRGAGSLAAAYERLRYLPLPDAGEPPWDCQLLTGRDGPPGFRVCYRVHHGLQDGVGSAHSALELLADTPVHGPRLHPPADPGLGALLRAAWYLAAPLPRLFSARAAPATAAGGDASRPCLGHRDVPLAVLRALADGYGVTVNDVCLAALSLALNAGKRAAGSAAGPARDPAGPRSVLTIMSTRRPHERHAPGNHIGARPLVLPGRAVTLDAAVAAVRRQTQAVRAEGRDAARVLLGLPWPLGPGPRLLRTLLGPRLHPLATSSITFPEAFTCFGARLEAASMFMAVGEGSPVYLSFTRTPGTVRCTVVTDTRRPGAAALPEEWERVLAGSAGRFDTA